MIWIITLTLLALALIYGVMELLDWCFPEEKPDPFIERMREIRRLEDPET